MIVKKHGRGMLVLLPALLCSSTLAWAETPQAGAPASGTSGSVTAKPKAKASAKPGTKPPAGASGVAANPEKEDAQQSTRSLVPNSPHPNVDPTQPWPRSGGAEESK
jgi:hypothetical protein